MKRYLNQDIGIGIMLIVFLAFIFYLTNNLIAEAAIFPYILIGLLFLFSITIIIRGSKRDKFTEDGDDEEKITGSLLRTPLITFIGIVLYCVLITLIGFFPSTIIFIILYLYINNYRSFKKVAFTVVFLIMFVYLVFNYQLNVPLPLGILFE